MTEKSTTLYHHSLEILFHKMTAVGTTAVGVTTVGVTTVGVTAVGVTAVGVTAVRNDLKL